MVNQNQEKISSFNQKLIRINSEYPVNQNFTIKKTSNIEEIKITFSQEEKNRLHNNTENFECTLCLHILNTPTACSNCEKLFCKLCITKCLMSNNNKCPCCKVYFINQNVMKNFKNILNNLEIICPLKNPCKIKFKLDDLQNHLDNCENSTNDYICNCCNKVVININKKEEITKLKDHLNICSEFKIPCKDCNNQVKVCEMADHLQNKCENRLILCDRCEDSVTYKDYIYHNRDDCILKLKNKILMLESCKSDLLGKIKDIQKNCKCSQVKKILLF